jgi:hypothetical protein
MKSKILEAKIIRLRLNYILEVVHQSMVANVELQMKEKVAKAQRVYLDQYMLMTVGMINAVGRTRG